MTYIRKIIITLSLTLVAIVVLVACSNESKTTVSNRTSDSTSSSSSTGTATSESEDDTDSLSEADDDKNETGTEDDANLTKTVTLADGTELTYRYKTRVKPGDYRKMEGEDVAVTVTVEDDGTFSINHPYNVVAQTKADGSFDINAQVKKNADGTPGDYIQFQANDGTYQIVAKNSTYGLNDGNQFTVNLESGTHMGQDFERYYNLLEENDLPTIQRFAQQLEDIIEYIEESFG